MSENDKKASSKIKFSLFVFVLIIAFGAFLYALEGGTEVSNQTMVGEEVPAFELQSLEDSAKRYSNQDIASSEYTLLNVWASWCAACKTEHGFLNSLKSQGIRIFGINYRDERKAALKVLSELGNPYALSLYDHNGTLALDLGVIGAPETFLISPEGKIVTRYSGVLDQAIWDKQFSSKMEVGKNK